MIRVKIFLLIITISLVLSSCSTTPLTVTFRDEIIPENQQCKLLIAPNLYVIQFDDDTVSWDSFRKPMVIIIPEGEHTIFSTWSTSDLYVPGILSVRYVFKAGRNYRLYGQVNDLLTSKANVKLIVQDVTNNSTYKRLFE
jgi:hypothetical protein